MQMSAMRDATGVVLGPCPGCENWQVDYTDEVARSYMEFTLTRGADTALWHEVVEGILQDHLQECAGLQQILFGS